MTAWYSSLNLLFAQAEAPAARNGDAAFLQWLPFIAIAVLFYFMLIRPQSRERQAREAMLKALKKNDRVITIGGIIGTVANLGPDDREVTIKVDDNTKLRMLRSSIQSVITDTPQGDPSK